jgi:hypothetical protein
LELDAFGAPLADFKKEIKGHKLLDKERFRWSTQGGRLADSAANTHALSSQRDFRAINRQVLNSSHTVKHAWKWQEVYSSSWKVTTHVCLHLQFQGVPNRQ